MSIYFRPGRVGQVRYRPRVGPCLANGTSTSRRLRARPRPPTPALSRTAARRQGGHEAAIGSTTTSQEEGLLGRSPQRLGAQLRGLLRLDTTGTVIFF